jgi:hypothetical protein
MIRATIQNGEIRPLDPIPVDWPDGHELIIEYAGPPSMDDLEEWYRELKLLGPAQYEPGEWDQVQLTLKEADEQAKAIVRREMGLD